MQVITRRVFHLYLVVSALLPVNQAADAGPCKIQDLIALLPSNEEVSSVASKSAAKQQTTLRRIARAWDLCGSLENLPCKKKEGEETGQTQPTQQEPIEANGVQITVSCEKCEKGQTEDIPPGVAAAKDLLNRIEKALNLEPALLPGSGTQPPPRDELRKALAARSGNRHHIEDAVFRRASQVLRRYNAYEAILEGLNEADDNCSTHRDQLNERTGLLQSRLRHLERDLRLWTEEAASSAHYQDDLTRNVHFGRTFPVDTDSGFAAFLFKPFGGRGTRHIKAAHDCRRRRRRRCDEMRASFHQPKTFGIHIGTTLQDVDREDGTASGRAFLFGFTWQPRGSSLGIHIGAARHEDDTSFNGAITANIPGLASLFGF